jgi:mannan polymerase II complex MNN11 subunit
MLRRSRVQAIVLCACALGALLFILSHIFGGSDGIPLGTPPVVIVTVLDSENYSKQYLDDIQENRIEYARKHGEHLMSQFFWRALGENAD